MMRSPILLFSLLIAALLISPSESFAEQVYISVGQARIKKSVLAFPDTKYLSAGVDSGDRGSFARVVHEHISNDLNFMNLFNFQSPNAFIEKPDAGMTVETFKMTDWSTIGTEFLIKTGITITGTNVSYEMRLFDVLGKKQILGKRYIAKSSEPLVLAHNVANDIIKALTGKPGIFLTQLTMTCDKSGHKEIWVMDFDGSHPRQITKHRTLAFASAWHPNGKKLVYSLYTRNYKNIKNIDLYEYDFELNRARLLSNRKGMNSGARYSPDGSKISLTMSFLGNPEIFSLNPSNREVTQLTRSLGFDVDPVYSPDGKKMAFVSTRHGAPMVYTMNPDGTGVTRITFAGIYNATPAWSPDGKKMVFAGDLGDHFDLFLINPDGTGLERLTKGEGGNEDPDFSPDGNFIAFTSNRAGQKNIYLISIDGSYQKRLTFGIGNCEDPKWGPLAPEDVQ